MSTHVSYCRICAGICGILVDVEDGRVTRVRGDVDHALTQGFTCAKGRALGAMHNDPSRFLESQRRRGDGSFQPVPVEEAITEIAAQLRRIIETDGPDAVAMFVGTQTYTATLTNAFAQAWFRSVGSNKLFTTTTIDQSAKMVAFARMGYWRGGGQRFEDADVWLLAGTNPMVSIQGGSLTGFPVHNPPRRLREARARGLTLIVIDPRRTETAAQADIHLQPVPGSDAILYAGLLHVIFEDGLVDRDFCAEHVEDLDALREAVAFATPGHVAALAGVSVEELRRVSNVFGRARSGMARSGTGPDMGPWSNLAEHLLTCLNVVCGRYPRAGDLAAETAVLSAPAEFVADVAPPNRTWERGFRSRTGYGLLGEQLPSGVLVDEILQEGADRVRALVVSGGNPVVALPDPVRTAGAFAALDLLVTVDPLPSETARLAHYVIAPAMALERADHTRPYERGYARPFAQWTPALLAKPPGVIEDWEVFARLAQAMDLPLVVGSHVIAPDDPLPSSDEALAWLAARGRVPLGDVRTHAHGAIFEELPPLRVAPPSGPSARFRLLPDDVAEELEAARAEAEGSSTVAPVAFRLIVRRSKTAMNTLGRRTAGLARMPFNACGIHPSDGERLGIVDGALVRIASAHGSVLAVAALDATLRPGCASLTHCYGDLPGNDDDPRAFGTNPNRLVSAVEQRQAINAMPRFSAIPVTILPVSDGEEELDRAARERAP